MYRDIDEATRAQGEMHIRRAHAYTEFRRCSAPIVGAIVAATDENWLVTIAVAADMATDGLDGRDARKGAKILGIPTSPEGAVEDPKADKALADNLMRGLVSRYLRQKDFGSAAIMGINLGVSHWRDGKMAENRRLIEETGVNSDALKAIPINKLKTATQMAASLAALQSSDKRTRRAAVWAFTAGTLIGVIGERQYHTRVQKLIANRS